MVFPSLIFISEHETVNSITGKKGNVIHKFKIFKKSGEKFSFVKFLFFCRPDFDTIFLKHDDIFALGGFAVDGHQGKKRHFASVESSGHPDPVPVNLRERTHRVEEVRCPLLPP
jgi:hypothetical protein